MKTMLSFHLETNQRYIRVVYFYKDIPSEKWRIAVELGHFWFFCDVRYTDVYGVNGDQAITFGLVSEIALSIC